MKPLDDIKTQLETLKSQIPMQKIEDAITMAKGKLPASMTKNYPGLEDAKKIIKRIDYLLAEESVLNLGKQEIFRREITAEDGTTKSYSYMVDFTNKDHIKRLRTFLTELIDLTDEDASSRKKEAIPEYLDYVAIANI